MMRVPQMMLPGWLATMMASPPVAGSGIHGWLFRVARQLHAHMAPEAVAAALTAATARCERRVTGREIRDAVNNSAAVAWKPGGAAAKPVGMRVVKCAESGRSEGWPMADATAMHARAADAGDEVAGLYDLAERSPVERLHWEADDWLAAMLPGAAWVCLAGDHPATARTKRGLEWSFGPASECGLMVPAPMLAAVGSRLDGQRSHRCLGNTGERRWVVVEWDKVDGNEVPLDEQAALHWHLRGAAEAAGWPVLRLVVHSGGKSLHGWYGPLGAGDDEAGRELMGYAVALGADPATWTRCQLVRLPGGRRKNKQAGRVISLPDEFGGDVVAEDFVKQAVYYYNPKL